MKYSEILKMLKELITNNVRKKDIHEHTRLSDLNVDSMTMVALATEIEVRFDVIIDPAIIYDLNNIQGIASYITKELNPELK